MMADNNEIFDLLTKMYSDLTGKIDDIHSEMKEMKSDFNNKFDSLEKQVSKNTILIEKMDSNIKLLAEGQEAFREQIGRADNEDKRTVSERLETIELAVKSTSKDIKVVKRRVENTEEDVIEIQSHLKIIK